MRDPNTVAGIVSALRQVHGDDIARVMLNDGLSLAALIDAVLRSPLKNHDAIKLITRALSFGDFFVTPDFGSVSHLKYFYDRPQIAACRDAGSRHHCQHRHPLATDPTRQLIEPETALGLFLRRKGYRVDPMQARSRYPSKDLHFYWLRGWDEQWSMSCFSSAGSWSS